MSTANQVLLTGSQSIINYDTTKLFLFGNRYKEVVYTNSTGSEVTLPAGLVMSRIAATEKVVPIAKAASDGSQFPVGINVKAVTVANGATVNLTICVAGDVEKSLVLFPAGTDFDDVVSLRTIEDRIMSDTAGIFLIETTQLTGFDNQ
jgi:hypothetical protein